MRDHFLALQEVPVLHKSLLDAIVRVDLLRLKGAFTAAHLFSGRVLLKVGLGVAQGWCPEVDVALLMPDALINVNLLHLAFLASFLRAHSHMLPLWLIFDASFFYLEKINLARGIALQSLFDGIKLFFLRLARLSRSLIRP